MQHHVGLLYSTAVDEEHMKRNVLLRQIRVSAPRRRRFWIQERAALVCLPVGRRCEFKTLLY